MQISEKVAIALGGNTGDVVSNFRKALKYLSQNGLNINKFSSLYTTPPVNCEPGADDFYNCVVSGCWEGTADDLLNLTQKAELLLGRPAEHSSFESRIIDIDIILFGNKSIKTDRLTVPHTAAQKRLFVLIPLNEIEPLWKFPGIGQTASVLMEKLKKKEPKTFDKINSTAEPKRYKFNY
ncbi:MAG: 2-amino-4-hydroxy-6-hydroxymethyldihydropteridine diphosphokinase [Victivallales bacterium]|nr:2-amino-4-hydroxy-6-hydroxymethyldihydropteridine diphosphokinase [Victivallales bacterium]